MNSLRFPLEEFLFPPLALSERERDEYERTAHILLTKALDEYDRYNREDKRRVNRAQWTPVKKRERLTVYKSVQKPGLPALPIAGGNADAVPMRRGRAATAKGAAPPSPPRGLLDNPPEDWSAPTLLQVGCIPGTLDDVMFGMSTFDATDMLLEASYTPDEALDAEMLCEIQGPTPSDPFRFLGIKWLVLGNPPGINIVVRPRDMVFLEATGVINRAIDGHADSVERVGYLVMHSVHLPGHGPLLDKKIVRARTSSCFLFKQLPFDDAVDVFMTSSFDPSGSVAEVLAVQSAAHTLTYCGQVTDCAYGKKLAWLLRQRRNNDPARSMRRKSSTSSGNSGSSDITSEDLAFAAGMVPPAAASGSGSGSRSCAVCTKDFGSLFSKRASRCALCKTALCSNCHVKKKVSFPGPIRKEIDIKTLAFCTACLSRAGQLSTLEVARNEVAARLRTDGTLSSLSSPTVASAVAASFLPAFRRPTDVDLGSKRRNTKLALDQIHLGSSRGDTFDGDIVHDDADLELDIQLEIADRVRSRTSSGATSSNSGGSRNSAGVTASARKQSALPRVTLIDADDLPRFSSVHPVDDDDDDVEEVEAALPPLAPAQPAAMNTEQAMMAQIAELRSTAESVYQYARLNTEAHLSQSASAMSQLQALALDDEDERGRQFMSARGAPVIVEDPSEH